MGGAAFLGFALTLVMLVEYLDARRSWRRDSSAAIEDELARRRAVRDALRGR